MAGLFECFDSEISGGEPRMNTNSKPDVSVFFVDCGGRDADGGVPKSFLA